MTEAYASFGVAASTEPLSTTSGNPLLQDADPAVFFCLDYLSWVVVNDPGARLLVEATKWGLPITKAVAMRLPYDPGPYFTENQLKFPLLAVYRKATKYQWPRIGWNRDDCTFEILYALPPMTAAQAENALPILRAVEASIRNRIVQGFDPGYTPPGGTAGEQAWKLAGIEAITVDAGDHGHMAGTGDNWFPSLRMQGSFQERDRYVSIGNTFTGGDITVNLTATDGTSIPDHEEVSTQPAPTVTSLSVTSGPIAGGTNVTITGTGFMSGPPVVLFGITPATSVAFVSATQLTCTTPAVSGAGTLGVSVTNRDGQSGSLASAFSFT